MKFNITKFIKLTTLPIILQIFMFSCGKETQNTTKGGGLFKVKYTFTPALQNGTTSNGGSNTFLSVCNSSPALTGLSLQWHGNSALNPCSSLETNEFSVTNGQNVSIGGLGVSNLFDLQCRTVKIEAMINGKVFNTVVREFGYSKINPLTKCADFDNNSVNFIIP
jgi:hypothetical protein